MLVADTLRWTRRRTSHLPRSLDRARPRETAMLAAPYPPRRAVRRGVAAVELALLLPFLAFLFVLAVDWSRVFYYSLVVENCARNGAIFSSDPYALVQSPYTTVQDAALADAPNLS